VVWGLVGIGVLVSTLPFWLVLAYGALAGMAAAIAAVPGSLVVYALWGGLALVCLRVLWRR
jgi:hypothetical protein